MGLPCPPRPLLFHLCVPGVSSRHGSARGVGAMAPPDFVSQLTLSQQGRADCAPTSLHTGTPGFSNPLTALCTEEEQKFNGYVYGYVKILEEDSTRLVAALSLLSLMSSQLCSQTKIIIFKFWRAKLFSLILKLIF